MTSGETLPRGEAASGTTTGIVLVAHGGQDSSTEPTSALQPAVLRMIPVGAAITSSAWLRSSTGEACAPFQPRTRKRGRCTTTPLPRSPYQMAAATAG